MHRLSARRSFRQFNFRLMARLTGMLLVYLAASMVLPLAVSLYAADGAQFALAFSAVIILIIGLFLRNIVGFRAGYEMHEKDSFWFAVIIWLAVPLCGALPYIFTGGLCSFTDALFESFSGFTTTGSSVVVRPEELPAGLLVYRAFTQWVGGLGLLLFAVAILRKLGVGAGQLYDAEFSGAQQRKLHPRLAKSVSRLWTIYLMITLLMMALLLLQGASLVDAICISFSTVSTGGFVTHADGLVMLGDGGMTVVTIFMFLSGINLALIYHFFTLHWKRLRDEELRVYLILFVLLVAASAAALMAAGNEWLGALQYALFHVASTMSSCGFYLPRPAHWSFAVSALTFMVIIVGASAGSTGGGIKLRRVMVLLKYIANYFVRMLHPNAVFRVKVNGEVIAHEYIIKVFAYVFLYIAFIVGGAFVLTLCGCEIPDALCLASANLSNLGPSPLINNLGGSLDYALLPVMAKWTLMALMLAGRLEIFAVVAVFSPAYWRR